MEKIQFDTEINGVLNQKAEQGTNVDLLELSSLELALIGGGSGDVHFN